MLLALTRRGNYTGREQIKGEAMVWVPEKRINLNALRGREWKYILAWACVCVMSRSPLGYKRCPETLISLNN